MTCTGAGTVVQTGGGGRRVEDAVALSFAVAVAPGQDVAALAAALAAAVAEDEGGVSPLMSSLGEMGVQVRLSGLAVQPVPPTPSGSPSVSHSPSGTGLPTSSRSTVPATQSVGASPTPSASGSAPPPVHVLDAPVESPGDPPDSIAIIAGSVGGVLVLLGVATVAARVARLRARPPPTATGKVGGAAAAAPLRPSTPQLAGTRGKLINPLGEEGNGRRGRRGM